MGIQSESALLNSYALIESGRLAEAKPLLEDALTADLDNKDLIFAVHSCQFWTETINRIEQNDSFEKGETLVNRWKQFASIIEAEEDPSERTVYAVRKGIYSLALKHYNSASDERDPVLRAEIYRKQGLCYKKLGSYENALKLLTEANSLTGHSAPILAEMADCYALCGESKLAKVLFREAFYVGPEAINLDFLDSPMINLLIQQIKPKGFPTAVLKQWIPVYGVLLGVFNVKRELRSKEVGHLKQEIYAYEMELKNPANDSQILKPKLMNMYFWLIDHYAASRETPARINEVLLKIKILDPEVYEQFIK